MQFCRKDHSFLEQGQMVIQPDCLHQVRLALGSILQVFFDDFFKSINIELLLKGRI